MISEKKYGLINLDTGEIEPVDVYEAKNDSWERVYAKTLVDVLNITGESQTKILAYLIKNKDYKNVVIATMRSIAEDTGCSTRTVQRTVNNLVGNGFLKKIQNGAYMFSPEVMRTGRDKAGMAVVRRWNGL
ncbi:hypothetical protein vBAmePPT11V19_00089 [Alteromonas phage vB_AmeP_PT11-V19]|nr:hypothetical protein vBAmePPT11V19_00089 [Alteromonas phage vB_AmeP_PT11-V19]